MRTQKEIIADLRRVDANLSPENLCCDGEATAKQVAAKHRKLMEEHQKLVKELGREPTFDELYLDR